jgi:hypothetical protein
VSLHVFNSRTDANITKTFVGRGCRCIPCISCISILLSTAAAAAARHGVRLVYWPQSWRSHCLIFFPIFSQPASFTTEHQPLSAGDVPPAPSQPLPPPMPSSAETDNVLHTTWVTYRSNGQTGHSSVPVGGVDQYGRRMPLGSGYSNTSTSPTNTMTPTWAVDQYGNIEPQSLHGAPGSPTPSASPTNTHSERTWASGPVVDYYEHKGQPQVIYDGSVTSGPSTSTERRLISVSERSSVPSVPIDQNEYRVASPPVPTSDTLPEYSV